MASKFNASTSPGTSWTITVDNTNGYALFYAIELHIRSRDAAGCTAGCGTDSARLGAEVCDDGNTADNMGCASNCLSVLSGWTCTGGGCCSYDTCHSTCGDSVTAITAETCDDGNANDLDGCSSSCLLEPGWNCNTAVSPTTCTEICGDG